MLSSHRIVHVLGISCYPTQNVWASLGNDALCWLGEEIYSQIHEGGCRWQRKILLMNCNLTAIIRLDQYHWGNREEYVCMDNTSTDYITTTKYIKTSSIGNIFRITEPSWREPPVTAVVSPHKGQWREALMLSLTYAWTNGWVNNRDASDLRRHRAHYDVTVMNAQKKCVHISKWWDILYLYDKLKISHWL